MTGEAQFEADLSPTIAAYGSVADGDTAAAFNDDEPNTSPQQTAFANRRPSLAHGAIHCAYSGSQVDSINLVCGTIPFKASTADNSIDLEDFARYLPGALTRNNTSGHNDYLDHLEFRIPYASHNANDPNEQQPIYALRFSSNVDRTKDFPHCNGARASENNPLNYPSRVTPTDYLHIVRYVTPSHTRSDRSLDHATTAGKRLLKAHAKNAAERRLPEMLKIGSSTATDPLMSAYTRDLNSAQLSATHLKLGTCPRARSSHNQPRYAGRFTGRRAVSEPA